MKTQGHRSCESCIWSDQCENEFPCGDELLCEDYSPADEALMDEMYYIAAVYEDIDDYLAEADEYA